MLGAEDEKLLWTMFSLLFRFIAVTVGLEASLSRSNTETGTGLVCETYECKDGDCTVGTEVCEEGETEKPMGCFVVWSTNNVTSRVLPRFQITRVAL